MGFFSKKKENEDIPEIPAPPVFFPTVADDKKDSTIKLDQNIKIVSTENKDTSKTDLISSEKKDSDVGADNAPIKNLIIPPISSTSISRSESIPPLPQQREAPQQTVQPAPIVQPVPQKPIAEISRNLIIPPMNSVGISQSESIPPLPQQRETPQIPHLQQIHQRTNTEIPRVSTIPPINSTNTHHTQTIPVLHEQETQPYHHFSPSTPKTKSIEGFSESRITKPEEYISNKNDNPVRKDASESIFVRIDKFHSAKKDIDEIDRDLKQISQVIEKINDIKNKEDEEITEIGKTMDEIKNRIQKIDSEIFNRI